MLVFAVLFCAAWLTFYLNSLDHILDARRLVGDLLQLPIDQIDFNSARIFSESHGGTAVGESSATATHPCLKESCDFVIHVTPVMSRFRGSGNETSAGLVRILAAFGLRPWSVAATLSIRENRLTHVHFAAGQARPGQSVQYFVDISPDPKAPTTLKPVSSPKPPSKKAPAPKGKLAPQTFTVARPQIWGHSADVLQVWAIADEAESWHRAFDIDLTCFVTLYNGCRDPKQLAPAITE